MLCISFAIQAPGSFLALARKKVLHFAHKIEGAAANIKELGLSCFLINVSLAGNDMFTVL